VRQVKIEIREAARMELDHVARVVSPELESLKKRFFSYHPDDPIIFHRKELVNKKPPFQRLNDPVVAAEFNQELLKQLWQFEYSVVTVVVDKKLQRDLYSGMIDGYGIKLLP